MAKKNKQNAPHGTVKAGFAPWAIIDKESGLAIGVFNPQGKPLALRRVALAAAQKHGLKFTHVQLIPVGLMSEEYRESTKVFEAPALIDENAKPQSN